MYAKKSLGQHFLTSPKAIKTMIESGDITKNETVVEIGPGKGVLTRELLQKAKQVIAIEKDTELIPLLSELFSEEIHSGKLILLHEDVLSKKPEEIKEIPSIYKVVANIPYYITGAIIEHFLSAKKHPETMILLMQKEVAERIVSRDGKQSVLSVAVEAYGTAKLLEKVPRGAFSPAPKVDSAIISIKNISHSFFDSINEKDFFLTIKTLFGKKRKQIGGSLGEYIDNKEKALEILSTLEINPKTRPEEISLSLWKKIALAVAQYKTISVQ